MRPFPIRLICAILIPCFLVDPGLAHAITTPPLSGRISAISIPYQDRLQEEALSAAILQSPRSMQKTITSGVWAQEERLAHIAERRAAARGFSARGLIIYTEAEKKKISISARIKGQSFSKFRRRYPSVVRIVIFTLLSYCLLGNAPGLFQQFMEWKDRNLLWIHSVSFGGMALSFLGLLALSLAARPRRSAPKDSSDERGQSTLDFVVGFAVRLALWHWLTAGEPSAAGPIAIQAASGAGFLLARQMIKGGTWLRELLAAFGKTPAGQTNGLSPEKMQTKVWTLYRQLIRATQEVDASVRLIEPEDFLSIARVGIIEWISDNAKEKRHISLGVMWNHVERDILRMTAESYSNGYRQGLSGNHLADILNSWKMHRALNLPKKTLSRLRRGLRLAHPKRLPLDFLKTEHAIQERDYFQSELRSRLVGHVNLLDRRLRKVVQMRFGIGEPNYEGYGDEHTLAEVGVVFNVHRERIRQNELQAVRQLRAPETAIPLRAFYERRKMLEAA